MLEIDATLRQYSITNSKDDGFTKDIHNRQHNNP